MGGSHQHLATTKCRRIPHARKSVAPSPACDPRLPRTAPPPPGISLRKITDLEVEWHDAQHAHHQQHARLFFVCMCTCIWYPGVSSASKYTKNARQKRRKIDLANATLHMRRPPRGCPGQPSTPRNSKTHRSEKKMHERRLPLRAWEAHPRLALPRSAQKWDGRTI